LVATGLLTQMWTCPFLASDLGIQLTMNGFLLITPAAHGDPTWERCATPPAVGIDTQRTLLATGDVLFAWGHDGGDIHLAEKGKDSFLVLSGYVAEIKGRTAVATQRQASELLLKCLDEDCSQPAMRTLLEGIYGSFGIFYRSVSKGVSLCMTDRMASRPLWTFWTGSAWGISTHAAAIANSLPHLAVEPGALASFLLYGGPVDPSNSLFSGLRAIPPGSIVNLKSKGRSEAARWYQFRHQPDAKVSMAGWVELVTERLVQAGVRVAKTCKNPAIFLSGGTDSRLVASALQAGGANPLLVTLGDGWNLEARVARRAAKALGLRHKLILRDAHCYLRSLPRAVYESGGTLLWVHAHFSEAVSECRGESAPDAFLLGDFGEAFSKLLCSPLKGVRTPLGPAQFVDAFDTLRMPDYRPQNREATLALLNRDFRAEAEAALRRDLIRRYDEIRTASADPLIVGDQFFRWDSAATITTFLMFLDLRSAAAERNIMFDRDVHELLEVLPSSVRDGANLGARLIKRMNRRAAWVPYANSLLPLCWPSTAHRLTKACKPTLGKLRRFLAGDSYRTTGSWHKKSVLYTADPEWRRCCEEILCDQRLFSQELFNASAVASCWRAFLAGDSWRAADVEKLLHLGTMARARAAACE